MNQISVAIDGPSGAGKSTLARRAARVLGFLYVDTGAIYRTVALACQRNGVDPTEMGRVAALLPELKIDLDYGEDGLSAHAAQRRGCLRSDPYAGDLHVDFQGVRFA